MSSSLAICNACGSAGGTAFFSLPRIPVHVGVFYADPQAAAEAETGAVELVYCHHCGHVFNRHFDPGKIHYAPGYEAALHHSPTFRRFMEEVADRLLKRFELRGKRILEIGAGGGWFLELLCRLGANHGWGVDPAAAWEGQKQLEQGRIEMIRAPFDAHFAARFRQIEPDFVGCLSVFEHIPQPATLLAALRAMIGDRRVTLYFEIFNAFRAFQHREIWSIHYEQCNYFSPESFGGVFRRAGFDIVELATCYEGGQYLFVDAVTGREPSSVATPSGGPAQPPDEAPARELPEEIRSFSAAFETRFTHWLNVLRDYQSSQRRVVFWGSGGKGVTFLNLLPTRGIIEYVAEINPDKQGKYIPGTSQRIVSPEFLRAYRPHAVIVSNALYEPEIRQQATELGLECEFHVA